MKQIWDNSYSANERYAAAFGRFFLNIFNLGIYYGTTAKLIGSSESEIEQEWTKETKDGFASPEYREFFEKNPFFQGDEYVKGFAGAFAKASTRLSKRALDSGTLVFAHTILDETLSECCRISFVASPKDWFQFIQERKVTLGELVGKPRDIQKQKAWDFIGELERQSIMHRFDLLHKVCAPKLKDQKLPTAWIKREQLDAFDQLRHRMIHGRRFLREVSKIEDQIFFAKSVGFSVLFLVGKAHGLINRKELLPRRSSYLRMLATVRREFPEFLEFIEDMAEKKTGTISNTDLSLS